MTAPAHRPTKRATHPLVPAFVRFVVCGRGVGLAASGALVLLGERVPLVLANAVITVVSTVVATELHSRITFRSTHGGWRVHLRSGLTVAVSYVFTTGALVVLHAVQEAPSALVEQTVYLSASAAAGVGRFALLRLVVFAPPAALSPAPAPLPPVALSPAPAPSPAPALAGREMAVAA
ncbi:GtrA family protein [Streptomyces sp. NPDC102282]|uniref:GtrA family protein n=1 Tax=Streptomyces sp. NPDC102282 TaxID=3366154 RepID=UPI0037F3FBDF